MVLEQRTFILGLALLSGYHWLCLHAEKQAAKCVSRGLCCDGSRFGEEPYPLRFPPWLCYKFQPELMPHRIKCFAFMLVWHFWCTCRILLANGVFWPKLETNTLEHAGFGFCSWTFNSHETVIFRLVVARQAYDWPLSSFDGRYLTFWENPAIFTLGW